ncbi:hypothetical protein GobsT_74000 [Gemmata obscuriglobus]|uniref:Uncharacterized protein n=1 Tax=Gemmata obscuriglobus TaxID=114 RepID=A0A2Z3H9H8_9BACT|nr:hypothetical protein [Gemmata obscuriglobus]AWM41541.1 hypothetical protein C1280_34105 [Gemmata obscuriglobus]QEG32545.1 hypothetical protein GobsT_74000 [Gemmata obscuriglobus]VTS11901.1 unnamed protein product [Gemmata obscuriglobus UQM 2246]
MKKLLPTLVVVLLLASAATADVPPPPPPKGKKYVSVTNEVVLGKDVTGYVFVQQVSSGFGAPQFTHEKLELTAGQAKAMAAGGRRALVSLFAVPQDAAKEFKTDAELFDALKAKKVKGAHRLDFASTATVSDQIKGNSVKWTHTVTAIDAKTGVKEKVEGEGYDEPKANPKKEGSAVPPKGVAAGLAITAGVLLGGLWLAARTRRQGRSCAAA